jgi:anti-sigma regulatory factor (Ser/Thr protein kinase)
MAVKFRLDEQPGPVSRLVEHLEETLTAQGVPWQTVHAVNLCVEELLVNIVNHGYGGTPSPDVEVELELQPGRVIIEVSDAAPAFDPTSDALEPDLDAGLDERPIGGLGVHLVKRLTDHMSYRRVDGRNHVRLEKRFEASSRET